MSDVSSAVAIVQDERDETCCEGSQRPQGDSMLSQAEQLAHRAEFQRVLMHLAVGFVNAPLDSLDDEINNALAQVGAFSGSDRAYLFRYHFELGTTSNTHEWCGPGVDPMIDELQDVPLAGLDDWVTCHRAHRMMHVPWVPDLRVNSPLRNILEPQGVLTLITVPLWHEGRVLGFVGFDAVTGPKAWSEDERTLLEVLAELFTNAWVRRDRENEIIRAQRAAEQASMAKSRFLATMSHELRTPMNGVLGMAELLLASDLDPKQREFAQTVHRSGNQLLHLLNDVLDVAKVESGRMELEHVPFDPAEVTREIAALATPAAQAKDLVLSLATAADIPQLVLGDQARVRQILTNVVGNAVKFTEAGGVRISLESGPRLPRSATLIWQVADTGLGIEPTLLPRIFEPFTQADTSIARRYGGTGLGLTIVRDLVELIGGDLHVDSTPGEGTSFTLSLTFNCQGAGAEPAQGPVPTPTAPAVEESAVADDPAVPTVDTPDGEWANRTQEAALAGLRVLVAEDNKVNRMLATAHLRALGCEVLLAEDGSEAVAAVAAGGVDVVLMDCRMPVLDGFDATREIRAEQSPAQRVPIVALTANAMADDRDACLAAGMDGFLAKPYTRHDLQVALCAVLGAVSPARQALA